MCIEENSDLSWKWYFGGNFAEKELPTDWNELYIAFRIVDNNGIHIAQPIYINKGILSATDNNYMTTGSVHGWLYVLLNINMYASKLEITSAFMGGAEIGVGSLTIYILYK